MNLILLQDVASSSLVMEIAKQGVTAAMLVVAVIYFYKRMTKLEEKLDKYMDEDRKAVMSALAETSAQIGKNTEVMEKVEKKL